MTVLCNILLLRAHNEFVQILLDILVQSSEHSKAALKGILHNLSDTWLRETESERERERKEEQKRIE